MTIHCIRRARASTAMAFDPDKPWPISVKPLPDYMRALVPKDFVAGFASSEDKRSMALVKAGDIVVDEGDGKKSVWSAEEFWATFVVVERDASPGSTGRHIDELATFTADVMVAYLEAAFEKGEMIDVGLAVDGALAAAISMKCALSGIKEDAAAEKGAVRALLEKLVGFYQEITKDDEERLVLSTEKKIQNGGA